MGAITMGRNLIVRLDSYDGSDGTFLHCGNLTQDFMFAVVHLHRSGNAEIVDIGYRSVAEAIQVWPDAAPKGTSEPPLSLGEVHQASDQETRVAESRAMAKPIRRGQRSAR